MVKIKIIYVGRIKEKYYSEAAAEYLKRLSRFARVEIAEIKEEPLPPNPSAAQVSGALAAEGERIAKEAGDGYVCLAIEGEKLSSEAFAAKIAAARDRGGDIVFVIGGSQGIDAAVKRRAAARVSFSDMTFPHSFARIMLLEQLYRAFMIDSGGKYHK